MKNNTINEQNIETLMDSFYDKIRVDKDLGDIFNAVIGTSDEDWEVHKQKISDFWKGILFGSGVYNGNSLQKHFELLPFPKVFFTIWLGLFEDSLDEIYDEENKIIILQKAQMIANRFMHMLYND
ncbi:MULTISPECIES: group III truncated hemoglobin [Campylobacter]|uniref:group III truncated hemoglobin n=1 Tax=Campylobacter TaxID=194 RepID=UPI00138E1E6A|nr:MULTISPECIES: group III truncated hemoglobin [Campylobacter]MDV2489406.1 group III truncated hemoglobin [Campylobacter sp. TJR-1]